MLNFIPIGKTEITIAVLERVRIMQVIQNIKVARESHFRRDEFVQKEHANPRHTPRIIKKPKLFGLEVVPTIRLALIIPINWVGA
jgi:hypothetical protein